MDNALFRVPKILHEKFVGENFSATVLKCRFVKLKVQKFRCNKQLRVSMSLDLWC